MVSDNLLFQHNGHWQSCQWASQQKTRAVGLRNLNRVCYSFRQGRVREVGGCAMRLTILALFLSAGTTVLCQSAAPANPEKQWLILPDATTSQPARDFSKLPPDWHFTSVVPMQTMKTVILPGQLALQRRSDLQARSQIDPKIVVHPPQSSLGEQPPGALLAQNLYPGLQLLPIEECTKVLTPIPTTWPNLKLEQIPTVWPKPELLPVDGGAKGQAAGK